MKKPKTMNPILKKISEFWGKQHWLMKGLMIVLFPLAIIGYVALKLLMGNRGDGGVVIFDKDEFMTLEKNDSGTEKLPETPKLDKTLRDISKTINQ